MTDTKPETANLTDKIRNPNRTEIMTDTKPNNAGNEIRIETDEAYYGKYFFFFDTMTQKRTNLNKYENNKIRRVNGRTRLNKTKRDKQT